MDVPITKPSMVSYADELDFNDLRMDLGKEKKNGFIRVTSGSREGCILYQNGKEVAASCENLSKIEALSEIIEDIKEPNTLIEVFNVSPSQVKYLIDLNKFFLFDKEIDPVEELKVVEKVETQVKTEKEPVVQPKGETEPVTEAQRKTEPQVTQTKVESNVKDETEVETELRPQNEVETEIKSQTEVKSEVKQITDAEVNPVPEPVPQKEATDSETTITAESQVETQPEPLSQIKPIRANEPKAQPGSEAKSLEEPIATDKPQVETELLEEIKLSEEPKVEEKPEVEIQGELVDARPIKKPKPEAEKPTNKVVETKVEYVSEVKPPTQGKSVSNPENVVKGEESPQEVVESYIKYQSEQQAEDASLTPESESEIIPSQGEPVSEVTPSASESESEVTPSPGELESDVTPKSPEESMVKGDGEPQPKVEPNSDVTPVEETETEPEKEEEPVSRDELMSKFGIKEPEEEDVESFIESYSGGIVSDEDLPNIEFTLTNKIRKSVLGIPKINAAQVNLILDNSKGLEGTINIVAEYEAKGFLSGLRRASKEETFTEQITYATVIEIRKIFREYPEVLDYFEINVSFS